MWKLQIRKIGIRLGLDMLSERVFRRGRSAFIDSPRFFDRVSKRAAGSKRKGRQVIRPAALV